MASLKDIYEKYFGQIKNTKSLFIILMIGIILLVVSGSFGNTKKETKTAKSNQTLQQQTTKELEEKLSKTLSDMKGVGSVSVMITYEDNGQNVYVKDESLQDKTSAESGKTTHDKTADDKLVLKNDAGGGQSPVLIKNMVPKISGVLVVAQGAEDINVKSDIVNAVKAVLDVMPHRVQVLSK